MHNFSTVQIFLVKICIFKFCGSDNNTFYCVKFYSLSHLFCVISTSNVQYEINKMESPYVSFISKENCEKFSSESLDSLFGSGFLHIVAIFFED